MTKRHLITEEQIDKVSHSLSAAEQEIGRLREQVKDIAANYIACKALLDEAMETEHAAVLRGNRLAQQVGDRDEEIASLKSQLSQFGRVVNEAWAFVTKPWGAGPHPAPTLRDACAGLAASPTGEATAGLPAGYQCAKCGGMGTTRRESGSVYGGFIVEACPVCTWRPSQALHNLGQALRIGAIIPRSLDYCPICELRTVASGVCEICDWGCANEVVP